MNTCASATTAPPQAAVRTREAARGLVDRSPRGVLLVREQIPVDVEGGAGRGVTEPGPDDLTDPPDRINSDA